MKVYHIKENWETHQILTNTETNLPVDGGPHALRGVDSVAGGLQRSAGPQILSIGVSSQYFDVGLIKPVEVLLRRLLFKVGALTKGGLSYHLIQSQK